ncbi:amidase [Bordetella ansorpii]|uniref:Amidase n=1 Tax=Bordetella ansorpii TaxID=288768 RepID=A0A157KCI1_9BORD|nr:amidase [Bordetella ansorpii]SAH82204.1 amidase [Bordetella ansorpii]
MQPYELTATEASALIAARKLSCEELARSTLARIEERDPVVRAWSYIDQDKVIRRARELDKTPAVSPLHGLTFGVKDVIQTVDMPTQQNSQLYIDHQSGQDAACVAVVRHSGALVVGKTDTVEFASGGRMAASRNPHNLAHTPGGSSSGSGAAVGDKQVQLAFGTQTGGSHIRPASFNGIYGIKPTHGAVSREGAKNYSHTLDTIGWYGRSVEDLQLVAREFRLLDAEFAKPVQLKGLKVGLYRSPAWELADAYAREALFEAGRRLEAAGAIVTEITLPEPFARLDDAQQIVMRGEGRGSFLPEVLGPKRHMLAQHFLDIVGNSTKITPAKLVGAYDLAAECRRLFDSQFGASLDVVLTPSSPGEAPEGLASSGNPVFNAMWTLLNVPCVGIPVGVSARALPLGIQLVGPRYCDSQLLEIALACAPAIHVHENGKLTPLKVDAPALA